MTVIDRKVKVTDVEDAAFRYADEELKVSIRNTLLRKTSKHRLSLVTVICPSLSFRVARLFLRLTTTSGYKIETNITGR